MQRVRDPDDHRVVRLRLSPAGERAVADLSACTSRSWPA